MRSPERCGRVGRGAVLSALAMDGAEGQERAGRHSWSWESPSDRVNTPERVWTAMFGTTGAGLHRVGCPVGFAERRPHPRSPDALLRTGSSASRLDRIPADYTDRIPRPGSPSALRALNTTLEDWADAEVEECGLHRLRPGAPIAAAARLTRSVTPLRHRLGVRPSRRSLVPLEVRAEAAVLQTLTSPADRTNQNNLDGYTPDRSILESVSSTRSAPRSLQSSLLSSIRRSTSASPTFPPPHNVSGSPTFSPPHSPLASRSPPKARIVLGRAPSPRAWYVREGGMRGGHQDTYEPPPFTVYQPKDRNAGKRVVFGKVVESPEEVERRAGAMKQIMRETALRISRQQARPHIIERSKAEERAKRAARSGTEGRPSSLLRDVPPMYGNGTSVRPSPWFST